MYLLLLLPTCLLCDSNKKLRYYNSKCSIILISCINMLCLLLPPATGAWPAADKSFLCHSSILEPYLNLGFIELNSGGNFNSSKSVQVLVELKLLLQLGLHNHQLVVGAGQLVHLQSGYLWPLSKRWNEPTFPLNPFSSQNTGNETSKTIIFRGFPQYNLCC